MNALLLMLALQALAPSAPAMAESAAVFPHERHARLFPLCTGCHSGIETGDQATSFPAPAVCRRCHDGSRLALVQWDGATRPAGNLAFSHPGHSRVAGASVECGACHATGAGERMSVGSPRPELCLRCHGGGAHLEAADRCRLCHRPLSATLTWDGNRIENLPQPAAHAESAFLERHGDAAGSGSCAVCHARESCERCHLNGARVPAIEALARDPRVAAIAAAKTPRYPLPASHDEEWQWGHGAAAGWAADNCSNCHDRRSCNVCHLLPTPALAALPATAPGDGRGVRFARAPHVHPVDFDTRHQASGANDALCTGCHERELCAECHAGSRDPEFHDRNFIARHGPEAFGNELQCSSCHSSELFCRSCHASTGRSAAARSDVVYHSGTSLWLIGHGQAARQSLESCASCHAQSDCARCHSALGGWGVNPHGSNFDDRRLLQQNRLMCLRCHRSATLTASR